MREAIDFSITVRNDGNVDLVGVALADAMFKNDEGETRVYGQRNTMQDIKMRYIAYSIHHVPDERRY